MNRAVSFFPEISASISFWVNSTSSGWVISCHLQLLSSAWENPNISHKVWLTFISPEGRVMEFPTEEWSNMYLNLSSPPSTASIAWLRSVIARGCLPNRAVFSCPVACEGTMAFFFGGIANLLGERSPDLCLFSYLYGRVMKVLYTFVGP